MYSIDERDRVSELTDWPRSCGGAPCPVILADEHTLVVAYYMHHKPDDHVAILHFRWCRVIYAGGPNNEALDGHPLAARGLHPYGFFEVHESSWIREMCRRNEAHPSHNPEFFKNDRHFILTFHDSMVECVGRGGYQHQIVRGTTADVYQVMRELLRIDDDTAE